MKKVLLLSLSLMLICTVAIALNFAPTVMTISGLPAVQYDFDGSEATFPVTVTGTPAAVWLVINTKGQAESINAVRNGYLGWHFVNNIDTTIFISAKFAKNPGTSSITWDGKDENGNSAVAGEYNYYLWAYDDKTARQTACTFIQVGFDWESQCTTLYERGADGQPLANPFLFGSTLWYTSVQPLVDGVSNPLYTWKAHGTMKKWALGGDPTDSNLLQTTRMMIFDDAVTDFTYGGGVLDPTNYNFYYVINRNFTQKVSTINKWEFVPGGAAVMDQEWGDWDNVTLEDHGVGNGIWAQQPSLFTDNNFIYQVSPGLHQKIEEWNKLRVYDWDGNVVMDKMMHEWYMPDDPNPHAYINGAFHHMYSRTPNNWMLLSHTSCMHEMIDTTRLVLDPDDETDMIMFQNSNGDYFMDSAYAQGIEPAWYCLADTKETSMRRDSVAIDKNGFNVIGVSYLGLMSFGVSTQDGTSMGMMQFADDAVSDDVNLKGGGLLLDNGGAFDGLYYCSPLLADGTGGWAGATSQQTWYVASDSFKGILSQIVAVEDEAPAAFSVAQNSPNPFNPTTTINFVTPKADRVTVEVYNVAGQKVDTLVNGTMSAGNHSVVWNASGKSAGVYFYTVKAGTFSKTMKMTLLK